MKLVIWETATGKKVREFGKFQDTEVLLTLSPDGKVLAIVEPGLGGVQLWDVGTGKEMKSPPFGANGVVYPAAFAPDSRTLAVAFEDTEFRIGLWDVAAGKDIQEIKGVSGDFYGNFPTPGNKELGGALMFSPDRKELAASGVSGVHRWGTATGKELYAGDVPPRGQVTKLALSPDGKQAVAIYADQVIHLWDLAAAKKCAALRHRQKSSFRRPRTWPFSRINKRSPLAGTLAGFNSGTWRPARNHASSRATPQ